MSTPISVGVSASAAQSTNPDLGANNATYINFGAGIIDAPGDISPDTTSDPTATAEATGQGGVSSSPAIGNSPAAASTNNILLYLALGIGVLSLIGTLIVILETERK